MGCKHSSNKMHVSFLFALVACFSQVLICAVIEEDDWYAKDESKKFECSNGKIIRAELHCDGYPDCNVYMGGRWWDRDTSDEEFCSDKEILSNIDDDDIENDDDDEEDDGKKDEDNVDDNVDDNEEENDDKDDSDNKDEEDEDKDEKDDDGNDDEDQNGQDDNTEDDSEDGNDNIADDIDYDADNGELTWSPLI